MWHWDRFVVDSGSETGWGGHSGGGTGFSASTPVFACQYHFTNAQQLPLATCCSYRTDNGRSLQIFKKQVYFENWGELERISVHFFHSLNVEIGHRINHCTSFDMGSSTVTLCVHFNQVRYSPYLNVSTVQKTMQGDTGLPPDDSH